MNDKTSITALMSSFGRAFHTENEVHPVFVDPLAKELMTAEEYKAVQGYILNGARLFEPDLDTSGLTDKEIVRLLVNKHIAPSPLCRAAYTESLLKNIAQTGISQYVILGAGMDTFAFREPEFLSKYRVFEVDHPLTQADKKERIARAGWTVPDNLAFVPVDFTKDGLTERLIAAGFDPSVKSFFSWLGVTYYLSAEAIDTMLSALSSLCADGSTLAFDYPDENFFDAPEKRVQNIIMMAKAGGEPMQSAFSYSELEKLLEFQNDEKVLSRFIEIKDGKKADLKNYLKETQNIDIAADSVFDIQIKRLHEYKRQQMNALYIIHKYKEIKAGKKPKTPVTMIFGAKAAPAYILAKDIIHMILCLQELIDNDPEVSPYLKVVMVENYNVTKAEHLIPACDISEQISLASKEASGTGNMKFMLNGAVTLGTMDGANVEIHDLVGEDNIYIFGKSSEEVIRLYDTAGYHPQDYYADPQIAELVDFIVSKELVQIGDPENLGRLYKELCNKDWFMTLLDIKDYIAKKEQMLADYEDRMAWAKKMLINTAKAGFFSSDRTIAEYNRDIWKL